MPVESLLIGCLNETHRRTYLGIANTERNAGWGDEVFTRFLAMGGPFSAQSASRGCDNGTNCGTGISLFDLRRAAGQVFFAPCEPPDEQTHGCADTIVVAASGAMAWAGGWDPNTIEVVARMSDGRVVVLDSGTASAINRGSLTLSGNAVTWKHDGVVRSAQLT
jgi:hypothetical protein